MCVAGINATTLPCQHRWAHLLEPCTPGRNLQTCTSKLKFSGWEQKHATCPWCSPDAAPARDSTHRLFGSVSCPISPTADDAADMLPTLPRRQRTGSVGTASTLSRHSSINSLECEWAEKGRQHRNQNDRLAIYLTSLPHELLPSAKKYYPAYAAGGCSGEESSSASEGMGLCQRRESGKRWTRNLKFGRGMFKG